MIPSAEPPGVEPVRADANAEILSYLCEHQEQMVELLCQLVQMESPTSDKAALDRLGAFLASHLRALGGSVEIMHQPLAGDHVRTRWNPGVGGVLILCHMDTVWDLRTIDERPVQVAEGKLYGPGAFDMKGGITVALWAIQALRELDLLEDLPITLFITSDEETGSDTSRSLIEAEALEHGAVFVLEPAEPPDASLKTWRKGVGGYRVTVSGRPAHAGSDHERGINALEELAHQILAIQGFTNYDAGTTLNVGVAAGGTRTNVVPAAAWAEIDVRVVNEQEAKRVDSQMLGLRPHTAGATLEVSGGFDRPAMVRSPQIVALYTQAEALAAGMGIRISETGTGGASDGNFTAALGVPTLDGMGVAGDGGHALDEHVIIASLPERAALLAAMLLQQQRIHSR